MIDRRSNTPPIGFAEVPDFHVSIIRREQPKLRDASILVGGDPEKQGKVVAASADLRKCGITEGMRLSEALARSPDAHWVRTELRLARELSGALRGAIREEIEAVEVDGLAGFYLRAPNDLDEGRALAARLEERVARRTGLPLRLGIAPVRFAARLAAEDAGERGARIISEAEFETYLLGQPLERLPGVGPKTAARLAELGAVDVPGLRRIGLERLDVLLGNHGRSLWQLACGEDPKPLRARRHPDTLSRAETLTTSAYGREPLLECLARLAASLELGLVREGLRGRRLALKVTGDDTRTLTRSSLLDPPAASAQEIAASAAGLLAQLEVPGAGVRRLCLVVKGLENSGAGHRQLDLFEGALSGREETSSGD